MVISIFPENDEKWIGGQMERVRKWNQMRLSLKQRYSDNSVFLSVNKNDKQTKRKIKKQFWNETSASQKHHTNKQTKIIFTKNY